MEFVGDEDRFAALEAGVAAATGIERVAPGLAVADAVDPERVRGLAYTRRALDLLGRTDADPRSARAVVEAASIGREGTVAVRARALRDSPAVSTSEVERECGSALVVRGFDVDLDDPDHTLRVLFADDTCLVGWVVAESVRDFSARRPTDRPFFQPGSMAPMDARAYANLAGAGPGTRLVDPMCGTGGVLIEAGLVGSDVVGNDAQAKMVRGARENLAHYLDGAGSPAAPATLGPSPGGFDVIRGDATALALRDDAADGVVFDAPYGRQSKIARHSLDDLVGDALAEAARVAPRGVLVADRSWRDAAVDAGWRVTDSFRRRVHRSLVRHVHVLDRA
ncbi:THUMP domain-containing protein [Halobaculum magnesiiphilum]|uniref:TIGR01177 family methyltransferase n=1 Tax=Halobaculum magnesiiphilum TaxID=1017351 RepID=A0A8T8WH51_9EURY|nr:THUMP domain-containing protein [Halobaculum magnesiiphilum]QZP39073.1 TIGR01177 family methyltransferase [Halobaculum magnesiiphilum]